MSARMAISEWQHERLTVASAPMSASLLRAIFGEEDARLLTAGLAPDDLHVGVPRWEPARLLERVVVEGT